MQHHFVQDCFIFIHCHAGLPSMLLLILFPVFWFSMRLSFLCCSRSPKKKPFSVQGCPYPRTTKYELQLSPSNQQTLYLLWFSFLLLCFLYARVFVNENPILIDIASCLFIKIKICRGDKSPLLPFNLICMFLIMKSFYIPFI